MGTAETTGTGRTIGIVETAGTAETVGTGRTIGIAETAGTCVDYRQLN